MVNGCAFCVDMHSTEAIADGESTARLFAVSVWREAPLFSDAEDVVLAESLSTEFLVLLEALAPEERTALLLDDVFGYPHVAVAQALGRSEGASRQLLRRARQHLARHEHRFDVDLERRGSARPPVPGGVRTGRPRRVPRRADRGRHPGVRRRRRGQGAAAR
jgi:RNA polymerase sigma-70 factor (ECF subfamily)